MKQPRDASFDHGGRDGMVDLREILLALRGRIKTILAITVAVAIGAIVFVLTATPRFAGETQVLLENRDSVFTRTLSERELPGGTIDEQAVLSQVQIVTSREVARETIRRLGLVGNAEFDPLVGPMDPITRVRTMLGIADGSFDGNEEDRIFDSYYRALMVYAVPRSRVLAIEFRSSDPDLSARAANTIAEVYLEHLEEAQAELARAASNWLGTNIEDLRARVSEAEAAVESFRSSSRLFLSGESANISSQQLSDLNTRLAEARSAQADSEARAQLLSEMIAEGRAFEIPDVASNDLIGRLIEQRIDLRSQIALEQRTLLPGHPRILELRAQLSDLDEQITASAERTVRILENEARIAASRVQSLEAALDAQMSVVAQANESEVQLRALEREARAEREQLENYLTRYREAIARGSQNATLPDARIVSRAIVPREPVFPRKAPTVILATLGAAFVATGGVVVAALISGGAPAAPAMAAGYGHAAQRRDSDPYEQDANFGAAREIDPAWTGRAPPNEQAGAFGAAAVSAALAEHRHARADAPAPDTAYATGQHAFAEAYYPEADDAAQTVGAEIVDAPPRSVRPQPAAFIDIPLEKPQPPAEEEVLTGVRKLGARLRGTLEGAAETADDSPPPPARPVHDTRGLAEEGVDEGLAVSAEPAARDAAAQAEAPRDDLAASPSGTPIHEPAPAAAAPRSAIAQAPAAKADEEPGVATQPVAASTGPADEAAIADKAEIADKVEAAQTEAGPASGPEPAPAPSPKQALPETWQELVPRDPVAEPAEGGAPAQADKPTETAEGAVRHKPRLRRKQAARKSAADPREEGAQEDRLDAAWQEAQTGKISTDAPTAAQDAAVKGRAKEKATGDSVPVLDDGPPAGDSVPVPPHASGAVQQLTAEGSDVHATASGDSDAAYDFSALLTRLRQNQRQDRGQRVLVTGLGDVARLRRFGEKLGQAGARAGRCILVSMQDEGRSESVPGLSDLIAERASFFDVIRRDPASALHRVEKGRAAVAGLIDDGDGLDIALTAFQHTYGLVFMLMPDPSDAALLKSLAVAADTIVIAADREADDPELVDLYARVAGMGAADVVVAGVGRRAGVAAA
ncbi:MAG: Wzz/FepE/Etk N-terminal domain-containing protein [Salinarimonas sp.]